MSAAIKARGATNAKERSVFVGNIPYDVTEEMLKEIFSEAGSVLSFRLVTDRETGKPKGYGFCEYADGATALSAMRNLNGYEINGRNLRVDFADGGSGTSDHKPSSSTSNASNGGEVVLQAMEQAIQKFGPVKLYDMLVQLKEHARQRPEYTKSILHANPVLTHAIVQCFKTLQIPIPPSTESQPALLAPPPILTAPAPVSTSRPPLRSPPHAAAGGGILGMAPPASGPPSASTTPSSVNTKSTRWGARPSAPPPLMQQPPPPLMPQPPLMQQPPPVAMPASSHQRSRDPRARARDPRLKRSADMHPTGPETAMKRSRQDDDYDAIAQLARDMTPEKLQMLPPNERQLLMSYMQQHGLPY